MTAEKLRAAINGNLACDVRVMEAGIAPDDFHARYSALGKTYVYRVFNAPVMSPFWNRYALHEARHLNIERMRQAARHFLGEHDWLAFSAAQSDALSRVRTVTELEVTELTDKRGGGRLVEIKASAEGFLRYMVRSIAGTLLAVGRGELDEQTVLSAIDGGNRALVGATAPAHGLTLLEVHY
jgi:tRNA pseudouridine38-40 synthase